jgi:hypothetical protein
MAKIAQITHKKVARKKRTKIEAEVELSRETCIIMLP